MAMAVNNLMAGLSHSSAIVSRRDDGSVLIYHSFSFRIMWSTAMACLCAVASVFVAYELLFNLGAAIFSAVLIISCASAATFWLARVSYRFWRHKRRLVLTNNNGMCRIEQSWPRCIQKDCRISELQAVIHPQVGEVFQKKVVGFAVLVWAGSTFFPVHSGRKRKGAEEVLEQMKSLGVPVSRIDGEPLISTFSFR